MKAMVVSCTNTTMKHFDKFYAISVQLEFPKAWGNPSRIVNKVTGQDLHDVVWDIWREALELKMQGIHHLAYVEDKTLVGDFGLLCFEVTHFNCTKQLTQTIDWVEKQMHEAYAECLEQEHSIIDAEYTSVFDGSITCTSKCKYNTAFMLCYDIDDAENSEDADDANSLTDEYVTVNGKQLRAKDGVNFDY
jgi:hypothetical protein